MTTRRGASSSVGTRVPAGAGRPLHRFLRSAQATPLAGLALAGLLALPAAGEAGNGRLVSDWLSQAPVVDGRIENGEWLDATLHTIGTDVTLRIGNDARTLYLAIVDGNNTVLDNDWAFLFFDDEGGTAPLLDDGVFAASTSCQLASAGEGEIGFWPGFDLAFFREFLGGDACVLEDLTARMSLEMAVHPEGLTYEAAIPLDGPTPLRALPGQRIGIHLEVFDDGAPVACWPVCDQNPSDYRSLVLASGGCNTGPQTFGSGDPRLGLPLDWTTELKTGSGTGWQQSRPPQHGDGVFCDSNDTGGSGAAACVSNAAYTAENSTSILHMPLALAGRTSAVLSVRTAFDADGDYDLLMFELQQEQGAGWPALYWAGEDHQETVVVDLGGGAHLTELQFLHQSYLQGGVEGGYAHLDDVELRCGPVLFADGFQSGLTTHWSASGF